MSENDILLDKARHRYGLYPRCAHKHQTLCQHVDPEFGWFVAYQCDDCGMVTRQPVTADQLQQTDLPYIDLALWEQAIASTDRDPIRTITFMAKAIRPWA